MKRGIILLLIVGMPLLLHAQDTSPEMISLEEAIELAIENNYQLKQARNDLDLAEYQEFSAKADFLPSVSASLSGNKRVGRQFNQTTGDFGDFTINGFSSNLNTSIPLFTGFQNINNLRSSQYSSESQEETVQRVKENVIFDTASRYLQVLLDKELLQIANENLASSRKQLEQVQAQVEVGSRPSVDLYNQEATVANNELEVTNRENALQISRLQLIRTLQIDPLGQYEFSIPDIGAEDLTPREYQLQALVDAALENRSDLQSARLNIKAIEHQLKATKGSLYPSLNFSASLSSNYNDQNFDRATGELVGFQDQFFDQNLNRSLGLSVNIPIFDNFNRRTNVQSQLISYRNQQLSLENTELQVVQEVNQAYTDYQAVIKQLEATEKSLRAAERSYETERERYNVGATTLIELSNANAQYVQAQSDRARAVFNFVFQQKLLDYYIGRLDQNISLNQ
ncbi:TolC family protein [Halalkalibaculum sp. DA3122]|uniref:TolC family protein n=1 Tax=unclassified Halalkalibaculum TaxID=2964617 RepID=UPI003753F170